MRGARTPKPSTPTILIWIGLCAALLVACGGSDSDPAQEEATTTAIERGAEHYDRYCALCHGEMGEGYLSPAANALSNQDFLAAATDDFLREAVLYGRTGTKMSAFGAQDQGPLGEVEADELVAFLRSWQQEATANVHEKVITGDAQRGAPIYAAQCASCHGDAGEGTMIAVSLNNPVFLRSVSDGFIEHALRVGRRDTVMASYADTLSEQEIGDLVTLIRSWQ